jgi:hypothetical protein
MPSLSQFIYPLLYELWHEPQWIDLYRWSYKEGFVIDRACPKSSDSGPLSQPLSSTLSKSRFRIGTTKAATEAATKSSVQRAFGTGSRCCPTYRLFWHGSRFTAPPVQRKANYYGKQTTTPKSNNIGYSISHGYRLWLWLFENTRARLPSCQLTIFINSALEKVM